MSTIKESTELNILKRKGWALKAINHIYENDELIEISIVYENKKVKDMALTINTKSKTFLSSSMITFEDMNLFAKIALEGGFDINE